MRRTLLAVFLIATAIGSLNAQDQSANSAPASTDRDTITIAAVGDIMMGSTFPDQSRLPPNDGKDLLQDFTPILSAADIALGNLEGPLLEGGVSTKCAPKKPSHSKPAAVHNCFAFRVPTRYGEYLEDAGFDVMNLANNHAGDFGEYGRASTRKVLDSLGIQYLGSDRGRFATCILEVDGKRVGFVGFAPNEGVPNLNNLQEARRMVADLRPKVDLLVVSFHGGAEGIAYQHVPHGPEIFVGESRGDLRLFTHAMIDLGADLLLGHGPHVLRGMEIYKDRLIVYSMGNFCTYGWFTLENETALTALFQISLAADGKFVEGKLYPGHQLGRGGPVRDPSGEAIRVIRALSLADFGAAAPNIADDGAFTK
ncbi:MAG: CapA family protein [Acidobacteriia bacterium]|nr:CapA family protein [Terriglobia bacterium]